jgi:signal transduction histidine kinase
MVRPIFRWFPQIKSIRTRVSILFVGIAVIGSLSVRYINYGIISGLIYLHADADLRTITSSLDRLQGMDLKAAGVSGFMTSMLDHLSGNKLVSLENLLGPLNLVEVSSRRYFAGVFRQDPETGLFVPDAGNGSWGVPYGFSITVEQGTRQFPSNLVDGGYRVNAQPGAGGVLLVAGTGVAEIQRALTGLIWFYLLNFMVWGSLLGLVSWWLISIALKPLQRLAEVARRVQSGETNLRIRPEVMVVELGRLGEAFNAMLDRLEGQLQAHARFTADISHELGNPLGSVMAQMEMAGEEETSPEELRATLLSCLEITRRMDHLRQSLLDLSFAQARQGTQNPVINLEPVVEDALEAVESAARAKGVALDTHGTTVLLPGNPELLYQLLVNLLKNAIRHTPEGSVVRVRVRTAEVDGKPMVSIGVLDEGRGVPPEDVPGLFERFFRSQSERLVRPNGHGGTRTGLGLAICKSIAMAHQGIIRYSPGPQSGALFEVLLPAKTGLDKPG